MDYLKPIMPYVNANKYTDKKVADLIGSAPETMDTLEEVAAAIQENKDVETALNAAIGTKANQSELDTHTGNSTIHITASERTKWNVAKTHADSAHARTDATKVEKSTTNGNIKINGTETTVYTHPSGTNPHGTTKSDVGLGNVGNFKAVSTVESQGLTDTEKSNARANIGAQVAGSYASSTHTHDDRYYTGSEIDSKLSGKANSSHAHTKSQITDFPTSMPANGGTADTSKMSAKLQTYKSGSTTETYGTTYPVYAQWSSDGSKVNLKCDNYKVATDYATSAGSASSTSKATKADYITGFLKANSDQTWGNQTGTFIAGMDDSTGGSIAFRRDNPSSGKLSVIIDGNFYQNEGKYACLDTNNYSSYALPLTGGTITGTLGVRTRLSTPLIGGTTAAEQIKITTYSNHSIEFYPYTDNRSNCGLSSYKWYAVWSYAFSGASDRKLKTDIKDINKTWADAFIDGLKPSTYKFKKNTFGKTHTGFIAQDVEDLILSLGMDRKEFAGLVKTVKHQQSDAETYIESITDPDNFEGADENYDYCLRYDDFIAPLVAYCQNLKKKNTDLENKYNELTSTVNEILKKLN